MQIVIDIPKHIYEHAKEQSEDSNDEWDAMRAIANGIPFPKGHGKIGDLDIILTWLVFKDIIDELECGEVASVFRKATILETDKESE